MLGRAGCGAPEGARSLRRAGSSCAAAQAAVELLLLLLCDHRCCYLCCARDAANAPAAAPAAGCMRPGARPGGCRSGAPPDACGASRKAGVTHVARQASMATCPHACMHAGERTSSCWCRRAAPRAVPCASGGAHHGRQQRANIGPNDVAAGAGDRLPAVEQLESHLRAARTLISSCEAARRAAGAAAATACAAAAALRWR